MPFQRVRKRVIVTLSFATLATLAGPAARAQASPAATGGLRHTAADVRFMHDMIAHHAQALVMAAMAPTHDASPQVSLFCRKVLVSQRDEIELMQEWLRERGEKVPDASAEHAHGAMHMEMGKDEHEMRMPGMLTPAQLRQLDEARGAEFDRLFLTFMIQHHEGALTMVAKLFDSPGAGQTPEIFGIATGVDADQRAEIARMQDMLTTITGRAQR